MVLACARDETSGGLLLREDGTDGSVEHFIIPKQRLKGHSPEDHDVYLVYHNRR